MICKRCGAETDENDRFCRICGKRFRAAAPSDSECHATVGDAPSASAMQKQKNKKWVLLSCFLGILLLGILSIILLMPLMRQSFLSPAAYYLESEEDAIEDLAEQLQDVRVPLLGDSNARVSGLFSFEANGTRYTDLKPYLGDTKLMLSLATNGTDSAALSASALYDGEVFCHALATLYKDKFCLAFPEMTEGQVITKLSSVLSGALKGDDATILAMTGYTREQLTDWLGEYLAPVLLKTLEESEQLLDTAVVDGIETSTVSFTLTEELYREAIHNFSSELRGDETLSAILNNISAYVTTSEDFLRDFIYEFNLTEEDVRRVPLVNELLDTASPAPAYEQETDLLAFLLSKPSAEEISGTIERFSEQLQDRADDLSGSSSLTLTAYYQGTKLIGRSLKMGTQTLFECFHYSQSEETILEIRFEKESFIYHFCYTDTSSSDYLDRKMTLTRRGADAELGDAAAEQTVFEWALNAQRDGKVNGVSVFLGEMRWSYGTLTQTISNEPVGEKQTRFLYDRRDTSETDPARFKARAQLSYENEVSAADFAIEGSSDFGIPAFEEFLLSLKRSLQQSDLFERVFGEGSLAPFLQEEAERQQALRDEMLEAEDDDVPAEDSDPAKTDSDKTT